MTKEFGDWIAKEYQDRGWTMRELSRRSRLSISYISAVVSGDKEPGGKLFLGLAQGFNIPVDKIQRIAKGEKEEIMTDWLDDLRQLREAKLAASQPQQSLPPPPTADDLLKQCKAFELLRQVQNALLGGGGLLNVPLQQNKYEKVFTLVWQGQIYDARKPEENTTEDINYILVGVNKSQVYVNGKKMAAITPDVLKTMLVEAAKSPAVIKGKGVV
jgi:transcriptional regulator with XRE-family HTH domain